MKPCPAYAAMPDSTSVQAANPIQPLSLVGLHGIAHFNMASAFPLDSAASISEIAEKSGMHPDDAGTLIRHAITHRLFKYQPDGTIAHSAATRAITTIPHFDAWVAYGLENLWRDAFFIVSANGKVAWVTGSQPHSVQSSPGGQRTPSSRS